MARVTSSDVQAVINYDGSRDLTAYITTANLLTNRVSDCADEGGETLTADELTDIEKWLAGHLYTLNDPGYTSRRTADASGSFQGKTGMSLDSTFQGQTAKMLDHTGCLARLDDQAKNGGRPKASMIWLGKAPSSQTDYVDRD